MNRNSLVIPMLLWLTSCGGGGFHPPDSIKGNVPLIIANQTESAICSFRMAPANAPELGEDWVGILKPQAGTSNPFSVKPGIYRVSVKGCQGDFAGEQPHVEVMTATNLTITATNAMMPPAYTSMSKVPGYARVMVPVDMSQAFLQAAAARQAAARRPAAPQHCLADGEGTGMASECCSGLHIARTTGWYCCASTDIPKCEGD